MSLSLLVNRMTEPITTQDPQVERYRSYLLLLAQMQLQGRPQTKIDPSDIVQQTLLEAHVERRQFSGDESGFCAWLRRALVNNLRDALRALRRGKRDVARERSVEAQADESSARLADWLAADHSSPSGRAVRNEDLLRLADALGALPPQQREAIVLHHLQRWTLAEVAAELDRSEAAVAGLLHRGLKRLRELLNSGA
jgi:RNA polymerase sigma-70 factor (ECF subfamily)